MLRGRDAGSDAFSFERRSRPDQLRRCCGRTYGETLKISCFPFADLQEHFARRRVYLLAQSRLAGISTVRGDRARGAILVQAARVRKRETRREVGQRFELSVGRSPTP